MQDLASRADKLNAFGCERHLSASRNRRPASVIVCSHLRAIPSTYSVDECRERHLSCEGGFVGPGTDDVILFGGIRTVGEWRQRMGQRKWVVNTAQRTDRDQRSRLYEPFVIISPWRGRLGITL